MEHWVCTACRSLNEDRSKRCYRCRAKRPDDAPVAVETVRPVVDEWASTRMLERPTDRSGRRVREPSLLGALGLGTAAACFATAAWVLFEDGQVGRVFTAAWLVGFIVAIATVIGARGRTSLAIVMISGLLTIGAVVAGEYLIVSSAITPLGSTGLVIEPPEQVWAAIQKALPEAPLRPVLWLVAVFEGFAIPWARLVGRVEGT